MMVDIDTIRPAMQVVYDSIVQFGNGCDALRTVADGGSVDEGATEWVAKKLFADACAAQSEWGHLLSAMGLDPETVDLLETE
jgi:hypothetical protein